MVDQLLAVTNMQHTPPNQPIYTKQSRAIDVLYRQPLLVKTFIFLGIIVLISALIRLLTPATAPTSEFNTFGGTVTPGYSKIDAVTEKLGQPLTKKTTDLGQLYEFTSDYPTRPNLAVSAEDGTVTFIKEFLPFDTDERISTYLTELGQPDFKLKDTESSSALDAYVFVDEGLVLLAHLDGGVIEQKWYFIPTTPEIFIASWGRNLSTQGEGPEQKFDLN